MRDWTMMVDKWHIDYSCSYGASKVTGQIWCDGAGEPTKLRIDDLEVAGIVIDFGGGPDSYEYVDLKLEDLRMPGIVEKDAIDAALGAIIERLPTVKAEFDYPKTEGWDAIECGPKYDLPSSAPDAPHLGWMFRDGKIDVSDYADGVVVVDGDRDFMQVIVHNGATVVDLDHDADKHMPPGWSFLLDDSGCYTGWNGYDGDIRWAVVEYDPAARQVETAEQEKDKDFWF